MNSKNKENQFTPEDAIKSMNCKGHDVPSKSDMVLTPFKRHTIEFDYLEDIETVLEKMSKLNKKRVSASYKILKSAGFNVDKIKGRLIVETTSDHTAEMMKHVLKGIDDAFHEEVDKIISIGDTEDPKDGDVRIFFDNKNCSIVKEEWYKKSPTK